MPSAAVGEKEWTGNALSVREDSAPAKLETAVEDELALILLRLKLEVICRFSR